MGLRTRVDVRNLNYGSAWPHFCRNVCTLLSLRGGGGCQPLALSPAGHLAAGRPRFSLCKSSITSVALGVSLTSVFSESLNSRCLVDFRLALMKDPWTPPTPPLPSPAGLKVSLMRRGHPRCQSRSHILGFCHLRYPCFSFLSL